MMKPFPNGKRAALSITFDDARHSQLDVGIPILDQHGLKGTFYIMPQRAAEQRERWSEVVTTGHEIGNHTLCHPCSRNIGWPKEKALEEFTLERIESEITGANEKIKELLDVTPSTFAYPCGHYFVGRGANHRSYVPLVTKYFTAGRAVGSEHGNSPAECDLAFLASRGFDNRPWSEVKPWVDKALEDGTWLILTGHEAGEPGFQRVWAETLQSMCEYLKTLDMAVDTVANIARSVASYQQSVDQTGGAA